jgi:N-acetyl-anhydromuramyl-L-alanine amidase AmpD
MPEFEPTRLPELKWRESPNLYPRKQGVYGGLPRAARTSMVKPLRLIVIHTAEGGYAGTVSWLCNPNSSASAHYVVNEDGSEVTQLVRLGDRAWTQSAFNPEAIGIELAGSLSTRFLNPVKAYKQMRTTARLVAWLGNHFGLPDHGIWNEDRFTGKGYTRHGDLAPEGGHPFCKVYKRANYVLFRRWVHRERERGHFRKEYGKQ